MKYRPIHALAQKFGSSPAGAWFLARVLRHLDSAAFKLSGGRATLTGVLAGVQVVRLTTTGARSGLPRTSALFPVWDPDRPGVLALVASNFGQPRFPAWYFNLKKNPQASCQVGGKAARYRVHEAGGEEYERFWQRAIDIYFGYRLYQQRAGRRIPILVLVPLDA